ncbi:efflux RND transporter permease subunit [Pseudoalteromonas luteoviolacea]|uniref:efflux RND transporter permease subunit n=1 Tax=Pseudoalteromonas luteoviolacea TaxID=43657 RepID=UPI001B3A5A6D|nr:CusA/CzcA family heavy metal efflux RND transporter [Pseudoalteromonas luteoviolacea]MBQ4877154.1 efflux RND transporter permease subunit [Pseudoalteromonas luteoviolacea]MBQ4906015.1 efflux RND transporter permease subunit [Pseudoalteromonas luteoviolacea]
MLNYMISWSVNNRYLILVAVLALLLASITVTQKLSLDAFPDVTNTQVVINTEAPGLGADEVEQLITYPIEAVMYALPDVAQVRSTSKTGLSGVTVAFKEGVDIYFARQLVFERLQQAKAQIPIGIGIPEIGPNTSGLGQIFQYLIVSEPDSGYDTMALRSLNDWLVKMILMPVDGVTDVLSFGGEVKQYQVNLNPQKLLSYELRQSDIQSALEKNNVNAGGWYMERGQEQLVIRGAGWFASGEKGLKQISKVPVKVIEGTTIHVGDVADVQIGAEIRQGAVTMTRRNNLGEVEVMGEVVSGIVLKRTGANSKETIDAIYERLARLEQALPKGVKIMPFYDQSDLVDKAVETVASALGLAFIFISLVLTLFLLNLRAALLVLISIPLSIGMALMTMTWLGISANLMSLGGLAIAIGMLVDGSVVMVENIVRKLQEQGDDIKNNQNSVLSIVSFAAKEVTYSIFFASLIILLVFMPLFSFEGVEARMFEPMAISIMLAVAFAVIVALIFVPALACIAYRSGISIRPNKAAARLEAMYRACLVKVMDKRRALVVAVISLICISAFLATKLGTEFAPELEEGTINLRVTLASSASLETALDVAPKIEAYLLEIPEVSYALSRIGRAEIGGDPEPVNNIEIYIGLKPIEQWQSASNRSELQALMKHKLAVFPGIQLNFSQPIATRVDELLSGVKAQLAIKLMGPDLDVLAQKGTEVEAVIRQIEGAVDVAMEQVNGEAQLLITPDRQALARFNLTVSDIMSVVNEGVGGQHVGQIVNGNERYDIYLRLDKVFRNNPKAISNLILVAPSGEWVRLGDVAHVAITTGTPQIRRDDVQRRVVIEANIEGRDMGSVVSDIYEQVAEQVALPAGYSVVIGGQFERQQRAQQKLLMIVPLSLILISLMLFCIFRSVRQALLILLTIPLAVVGGVCALYFSGLYLSVASSVGFITLFGVAILNGVVMVESINKQGRDKDIYGAVLSGASVRIRPVLMTAITSALGLIPMLLSHGVGAELQKPIAAVVIGGLVSSTLLTLIIIPIFYPTFSRQKWLSDSGTP